MDKNGKLVKLSNTTYQNLVSHGTYGDTIDTILSRILKQNNEMGLGNPETKNL